MIDYYGIGYEGPPSCNLTCLGFVSLLALAAVLAVLVYIVYLAARYG